MKRKVILLTIDCLRKDRLSVYGCDKNLTPNIDRICDNSFIFDSCIANSSYTAASFYSLFTSDLPARKEYYSPIPADRIQFTEILQKNGINTCGIHSNPHLGSKTNYDKGFNSFFYLGMKGRKPPLKKKLFLKIFGILEKFGIEITFIKQKILSLFQKTSRQKPASITDKRRARYVDAKKITRKAMSWLANNHNSDFFLWVHYMDVHTPYYPPLNFLEKINDTNEDITETTLMNTEEFRKKYRENIEVLETLNRSKIVKLANLFYNGEIRYVDFYIGVLVKYLKRLKIYKDSIIIITADHGESIYEHNSVDHQALLFDELLRIPLTMKFQDIDTQPLNTIKDQVSLIDIGPTILEMFEIPPENTFQGLSLLPLVKMDKSFKYPKHMISALLRNGRRKLNIISRNKHSFYLLISCRTLKWKLIYDDQIQEYQLYNLESDPEELNNLIDSDIELHNDMKKYLKDIITPYVIRYNSEEGKITRAIFKGILNNLKI